MTDHANQILALLFSSPQPITIEKLSELTELKTSEVSSSIKTLNNFLDNTCLEIKHYPKGVILVTQPNYAALIQKLEHNKKPQLSNTSLEVLAIIAYRQPIAKSAIDEIRGVQSDSTLESLRDLGLVAESIKTVDDMPETQWCTTEKFLMLFGFDKLEDLPQDHEQETAHQ